jgi:hypothetical protein
MATTFTQNIGRLQRVALRDVWKHEAYDFTQWLQENIDVLNIALDLNLVNVEREQAAGSFSVDLVAEDEGGGTVIIENQLEKSNHDHLGKVITYLTAFTARAAIWIVSEPRPEHVKAIAWLNESTGADFYLVKVEAVKIGDSPAAPLLTLIVGPSEDNTVRAEREVIAERYHIRQHFWKQLVANPKAKLHSHITPGSYSWIGTSSGVRGLNLNYSVTQDQSTAELYIDRGRDSLEENKSIFDQLLATKDQINEAIGREVSWERLDGKRASRIRISIQGGYRSPETDWTTIQDNMADSMNALSQALTPYLRRLQLGS